MSNPEITVPCIDAQTRAEIGGETRAEKRAGSRVGPNAVIQTAEALRSCLGEDATREVFQTAGHLDLLDHHPQNMIDEAVPARLFATIYETLPPALASRVSRDAGWRTANYVIENRIPAVARRILRGLPAQLSKPLLLNAIAKNAWTFAGSGDCRTHNGTPAIVEIAANPLAMPGCDWHRAVFETMFRNLVAPNTTVSHPTCCAEAGQVCRFKIVLNGARDPATSQSAARNVCRDSGSPRASVSCDRACDAENGYARVMRRGLGEPAMRRDRR